VKAGQNQSPSKDFVVQSNTGGHTCEGDCPAWEPGLLYLERLLVGAPPWKKDHRSPLNHSVLQAKAVWLVRSPYTSVRTCRTGSGRLHPESDGRACRAGTCNADPDHGKRETRSTDLLNRGRSSVGEDLPRPQPRLSRLQPPCTWTPRTPSGHKGSTSSPRPRQAPGRACRRTLSSPSTHIGA
jgi:hypothetical protein